MRNLVSIASLGRRDIESIWALADAGDRLPAATIAWSFEGRGVRTRAAFIQAFRELGLDWTELPDLLKTSERPQDLAGYLDPFFDGYVVRESDDERLRAFAAASTRPVINAMSRREHPCEVLADALYIDRCIRPLSEATVCLWGPTTNVFRSWHELARVLGVRVVQVCDRDFHEREAPVSFLTEARCRADVVITDAWPAEAPGQPQALTLADLQHLGSPALLPTPPFTIGRELAFDPTGFGGFVGYGQKRWLLPVHKAILRWAMSTQDETPAPQAAPPHP